MIVSVRRASRAKSMLLGDTSMSTNVLLGDAARFLTLQYGLAGRTEAGEFSRRPFAPLSWRKNTFDQLSSAPEKYALREGSVAFVHGEPLTLSYGAAFERWVSPAKFSWPLGPSHIFYRAHATPLRRGRVVIVNGDSKEHAEEISGLATPGGMDLPGLRVTFVEKTEHRPRVGGVYVQSRRSWAGSFPSTSYLSLILRGARFGEGSAVPISPYRSVSEQLHFHPADMRNGADLTLALWTVGGELLRWRIDPSEVFGALVKVRHRRTFAGRHTDKVAVEATVEYWRR